MTRTPSGTLGAHFAQECMTLARLLRIDKVDGTVLKLTDHDQDLDIPARAVKATGGPLEADSTADGAKFASNTLSIPSGNAVAGETVVISAETYTFRAGSVPAANDILIGVDASASLLNLARAINGGAGAGSLYGIGTTSPSEGVTAIEPSQTSTSTNVVARTGGIVIGDMELPASQAGRTGPRVNEMAFNGILHPWSQLCAIRPKALADWGYVGKNFSASPVKMSSAKVYGSSDSGYWHPAGTLSIRMVLELRASNGSLPGDPRTGGTLLGSFGPFPSPISRGSGIVDADNVKTISSSDTSTAWDFVWIVIYDQNAPSGALIIGEVQFFGSSTSTHPGSTDMGLVADVAGDLPWNAISTTETLTNGSWATPTMTGGADAKENVLDGETVTIDTKVYTFQTTLTDVDGNVHVGDSITESLDNLRDAIILGPGAGTAYAASMTVHPTVVATTTSVGLFVEAKVAGTEANGTALTETMSKGEWDEPVMSGGEDGLYRADPGFTASAFQSSTSSGLGGLDIELPEENEAVTQVDIQAGLYNNAQVTVEYTDWETVPPDSFMTLFAGVIGTRTNDDEKAIVLEVQGKFTRQRTVQIETFSPLCRADLGDTDCDFDIDASKVLFTVGSTVNSQFNFHTDLTDLDQFWDLGLIQWQTGNNTNVVIEVADYKETNGVITLFLPAPLTIQPGDTGLIWPGCDKTIDTCNNRYGNVKNFRGEPFGFPAGAAFGEVI